MHFANHSPMGGKPQGSQLSAPIPNFYRMVGGGGSSLEDNQQQQQQREHPKKVTIIQSKLPYSTVNDERSALLSPTSSTTEPTYIPPTIYNFPEATTNTTRVVRDINTVRASNLKFTLPQIILQLRILNLIVTTCTISCMMLTLWLKIWDVPQFILGVYCICGSALLCFYEMHIRWIERAIHNNFGCVGCFDWIWDCLVRRDWIFSGCLSCVRLTFYSHLYLCFLLHYSTCNSSTLVSYPPPGVEQPTLYCWAHYALPKASFPFGLESFSSATDSIISTSFGNIPIMPPWNRTWDGAIYGMWPLGKWGNGRSLLGHVLWCNLSWIKVKLRLVVVVEERNMGP